MDGNYSFLDELPQEKIYVEQPSSSVNHLPNYVLRLNKALYGLKN